MAEEKKNGRWKGKDIFENGETAVSLKTGKRERRLYSGNREKQQLGGKGIRGVRWRD